MPVEQTGETILFVLDGQSVEAHIQIEYDPEAQAEQFAWVVPVMAVPELAIGSQALFDRLLQATVPTYGYSTWSEPCGDGEEIDPCDQNDVGEKLDIGGGGAPDPDGPQVVEHRLVGAFEMFVLEGGTAEGVMTWLGDNGFAQDSAAAPILAEYVEQGFSFVAFKLAPDASAAEVHPVVLRMPVTEACVPIRLTRIASVDDLEIRTLFLAEHRVAPTNYAHVVINPLRVDWIGLGANYKEVVSMALDGPGAEGRGFVTEYAGRSDIVSADGIVGADWEPAVVVAPDAISTLHLLRDHGALDCSTGPCTLVHPLLSSVIARWVGLPEGVDPATVVECPHCFASELDTSGWSADGFAEDLRARVVEPAQHATELLQPARTLTRMYTLLSPHEMTVDPLFAEQADLPEVPRVTANARLNLFCEGPASFELPDDRLVAMPGIGSWPEIAQDMPWAERVETILPAGAPMTVVDNREQIDALLAMHNEAHGPARWPWGGLCGDTGGDAGPWGAEPASDSRPLGCSCTTGGPTTWPGLMLAGLWILALARRRDAPG
jgi:uncharacterized protein (TIGR03382 family)